MTNLVRFTEVSRKIVAVGRNYSEHAAELGNAVPSKPLLFMKVLHLFLLTYWLTMLYFSLLQHSSQLVRRLKFLLAVRRFIMR